MKVKLIMKEDRPIGYELIPETLEEKQTVGTVRDMIFFGMDDTRIVYDGITLVDGANAKTPENLVKLSFIQKKEQVMPS